MKVPEGVYNTVSGECPQKHTNVHRLHPKKYIYWGVVNNYGQGGVCVKCSMMVIIFTSLFKCAEMFCGTPCNA